MSIVRMPVVFFGHGSPMSALEHSRYTQAWGAMGASLPRPRAILAVSAHWYDAGTAVTAMPRPPTIHDFYGFPKPLYEVQYPAAGDPELARRVQSLLAPTPVELDQEWGLDHGTWSVLLHAFPEADVPVVQLRIDARRSAQEHFELAQRLAPLRNEGVLIIGSGNVVHNLRTVRWQPGAPPYDWATRFENRVAALVRERDYAPLIDFATLGDDARRSIPTDEHFLPLLYCLALAKDDDALTIPIDGVELGSISMQSIRVG